MTSDAHNRRIIERLQIPGRWTLLLLLGAILGVLAFNTYLGDDADASAVPEFTDGVITQFDVETAMDANGSIDPFAPFYGEGDMIGQSVVYFEEETFGQEAYGACFVCTPGW